MQNIILRTKVAAGSWTVVRQVAYTYYDGVEAHGNAGDLKLAVIEDASGNALDTKYYRYYVTETGGYQHALKYVFNPQSYARLVAALGTNLSSLTDTQVSPYADNYSPLIQASASRRKSPRAWAAPAARAATVPSYLPMPTVPSRLAITAGATRPPKRFPTAIRTLSTRIMRAR